MEYYSRQRWSGCLRWSKIVSTGSFRKNGIFKTGGQFLSGQLNPICPGPLGPDRFPGGGSKCPDSIQPTILMIFQILFLQGLRYVYKGLETKI